MRNLLIVIIIFLFVGCSKTISQNYCKNRLELALQVRISDDFKIVNSSTDAAIGDYVEQFKLQFSKRDYEQIMRSLDTTKIKKATFDNLYYFNIKNQVDEEISIIFDSEKYTIQYTLADL